jgi:hypothetical protein
MARVVKPQEESLPSVLEVMPSSIPRPTGGALSGRQLNCGSEGRPGWKSQLRKMMA